MIDTYRYGGWLNMFGAGEDVDGGFAAVYHMINAEVIGLECLFTLHLHFPGLFIEVNHIELSRQCEVIMLTLGETTHNIYLG